MKRTKFIMLALVVALVLMGAGYAAWTQVFTINSTVTTGELTVDVAKGDVNKMEVIRTRNATSYDSATEEDYNDVAVQLVAGDTLTNVSGLSTVGAGDPASDITFNLPRMFPGTKITNTIKFTNSGNMDVVTLINSATVTDSSSPLWNDMIITVSSNATGNVPFVTTTTGGTKLADLKSAIVSAIDDIGIGETRILTITQDLPITSGDKEGTDLTTINDTENKSLTWTVGVSFQQYNAQP